MPGEMVIPDTFDSRLKRHLPKKDWFSRQELIASLRLAYKRNPIVLLYGENGAGKTTSAAAFALDEATSGALEGNPVLYSSFEVIDNLTDLLESFGQVYEIALLERSLEWRTLDDFQRLKLIQDLLHKVPLLWIWDDFELVTPQKWAADEMQQLDELLQSIPSGGGRLLILAKRREKDTLGWLPEQIQIDLGIPNPLAQEIASTMGATASPGQARLPETLHLALSTFSEPDQNIISLMGLFRGILNLEVLCGMADEKNPWRLADEIALDSEHARQVFDQAAALKLCTPIATTGYYLLHPAVTGWLAKRLKSESLRAAQRAFTHSMAEFARQSVSAVQAGDHGYVDLLAVHEANLRLSLSLADKFRWRNVIIDLLSALRLVFLKSRRFGTWNRLLDHVSRHFIHPQTLQPISRKNGKDNRLSQDFLTFQVEISLKRDRLTQATRWQSILVILERTQTQPVRANSSKSARSLAMNRELASSLAKLGEIYRRMGSPKSIEAYEEAFQIAKETGQTHLAGDFAGRIAEAYLAIQVVQNFEQAENWTQAGLELSGERDDLLRSRLTALRGKAAYERFIKGQKANQPVKEQVELLNLALDLYFQALEMIPESQPAESGKLHEMIGLLYLQSEGMLKTATEHYDLAVELMDQAGEHADAARARYNLAIALFMINHFEQSWQYAQAALQVYEELGSEAVIEANKVRKFLARFPNQQP